MGLITDGVKLEGAEFSGQHGATMELKYGGQNGQHANIGTMMNGKPVDEWMSTQAYVSRNIIPVVIRYPKFFDLLPDKDKLIEVYKELIELHPLTIEGLTSGLTVETDEHAMGGSGEFMEEIIDVKRARSTLSFTYKEKSGKAIQKFLDFVIRYGYMDPDVKRPLVIDLAGADALNAMSNGIYTPDFYTGTVLFIEPDITQNHVVDAWLSTNMFFKSNGDRTGKRDISSAGAMLDLSIESSALTLNNKAVMLLADKVLASLTVISDIPDYSMVTTDEDIAATLKSTATGYTEDRGV